MSNVPTSPLVEIFGSNSSAELLVYIVFNHGNDFAFKDVADRLNISKAKVTKMAAGLLKYHVIHETKKVGKVSYYRYDRNSKLGKLLYELVFNVGTGDHAMAMAHATASPSHKKDKDDGGGKIIIA